MAASRQPAFRQPAFRPPALQPANPSDSLGMIRKMYRGFTSMGLGTRLVVVAWPFAAYFGFQGVNIYKKRYTFQLQQSVYFKDSMALLARSTEIRNTFGSKIKLLEYNLGSPSNGFWPWLKQKQILMKFESENGDGWIRMILTRNEKFIAKDEEAAILEKAQKETEEITQRIVGELRLAKSKDGGNNTPDETESSDVEPIKLDVDSQLKLLRETYPTLPEPFTQADLQVAQKIKTQRTVEVALFSRLWALQHVSVHSKADTVVLFDSGAYDKENIFLVNNKFLSILKPGWMKSSAPSQPEPS